MRAIEALGLSKRFKDVTAVDDLTLLVEDGDIVGLLGPNGAGKTTTIMMLLGITEPDAGEIRLLGHPLPAERTLAMEKSNFAASYLDMPDRLRVKEILDVFGRIHGVGRGRVREVAELFGITRFLKR